MCGLTKEEKKQKKMFIIERKLSKIKQMQIR